mgnify:FL=1
MKTQIKKELHSKTMAELIKQLKEQKTELSKMKMDQEMGKLKNTSELRNKKVEVAVISTIIKEKLIAEKLEQDAEVAEKVVKEKTAPVKGKADKPIRQAQGKGGKK